MTPLSAVGLLCVLMARKYTLKRNFVKAGDKLPGSSGSEAKPTMNSDIGDGIDPNGTEKVLDLEADNTTEKKDGEA